MAVQLREALQRVEEWERHHTPGVSRPHIDHSAEDRVADSITAFAGSMLFVYLHIIWFAAWILLGVEHYPFGLLTMIVSLEAIFLSTFVMIAQNRQAEIADARAQANYETNVRAEAEVMKVLHLVESLVQHHIVIAEDVDAVPAGDEKS